MPATTVFERTEKKYIITTEQKNVLLKTIADRVYSDRYGESTVCSLYFDTDDFRLIRNSIDKPVYKEKLRLRSYSTPKSDSTVFLELKKKYKGIVYKRRETMTYSQAKQYLDNRIMPNNSQIMKEIDWAMNFYKTLRPRMFIGYDRTAYVGREDSHLRITFDENLRYRTESLDLSCGSFGENIIDKSLCIMEIKALNAMPLWLSNILNEIKIYPSSFSKYGTAYKIISKKNLSHNLHNGGEHCA